MPNETIAEKLVKLNQIKANLKTQIEAKGVTVGTADFEDYPGLVEDIPSGGGGTLVTKSITANGTYNAQDDNADGYSEVTVNVPGEIVYYSQEDGIPYVENVLIPDGTYGSSIPGKIRSCPHLKTLKSEATGLTNSQWYQFCGNGSMTKLELPYMTNFGGGGALASLYNMSGDNHGTVQLGSIGHPVTVMNQHTFFANAGVDTGGTNWTVTIYVNASTLADIPSAVNQYQPWNATNATIVYRNSTTGEVITE